MFPQETAARQQEQGTTEYLKAKQEPKEMVSGTQFPTNQKMMEAIEGLRRVLHEQRAQNVQLDNKGHQIAMAADNLLVTTENILQEKNWDQAMQRFAQHVIDFSDHVSKETKSMKGDAKETYERLTNLAGNLKNLLSEIISPDTRGLLRELSGMIDPLFFAFQGKPTYGAEGEKKEGLEEWRAKMKVGITESKYKEGEVKYEEQQEGAPISRKLTDHDKYELAVHMRNSFAQIGRKPAAKQLRSDVLALVDYITVKKDQISPSLQEEFKQLYYEARNIVQRFVPNFEFEPLEQKFVDLRHEMEQDEKSKEFFKKFRKWADSIVNDPDGTDNQGVVEEGKKLIDEFFQVCDKYINRMQEVSDQLKCFGNALYEESSIQEYKSGFKGVKDVISGGSALDTLAQLRLFALPILKESLKEIKLEGIKDEDETGFFSVDNLILKGRELTLDDITFKFKFGLKNLLKATLKIKNISATFRNMNFVYEKRTMPTWSDKGMFDCTLATPGWKITWNVTEETGQPPTFNLSEVSAKIRNLDITILEAEHKWVDKLLVPLITPSLRRRVQSGVEDSIRKQAKLITCKFNEAFGVHKGIEGYSQSSAGSILPPGISTLKSVLTP